MRAAPPQPGAAPEAHPFAARPHRTLVALSLPVMASLVVEPLAGVVDTAFVERLGAASAAALGAATALLSSVLWVFNFLGVGTQTEVAQALGASGAAWGANARARDALGLALGLSLILGTALAGLGWVALDAAAAFMSGDAAVRADTVAYLRVRLLGAPAGLVLLAALGALRGLQDMRTPLWIAAGVSGANVVLDAVLVFGAGPIPGLGIAGAAWATTASQLAGAAVACVAAVRRLGGAPRRIDWRRARALLVVGRDMTARTAALLLFLLLAQRQALRIGVEAGAAHQAIRQVWMLCAFALDAFATAAQSLVGYFVGSARRDLARRVAGVACAWGLGAGAALAALLLALQGPVAALLVPPTALSHFGVAWWVCAAAQPLNALGFVTDGIHWGTADYAYLRNAMLGATGVGIAGLYALDASGTASLLDVWALTAGWIALRSAFGLLRVWPGLGASPLGSRTLAA